MKTTPVIYVDLPIELDITWPAVSLLIYLNFDFRLVVIFFDKFCYKSVIS